MSFNQTTQSLHCSNCGTSGHTFRMCIDPVSSYGVLVFRWVGRTPNWTPFTEFCKNGNCSLGLTNIVPEILMIQRKDTLGFMDIMRGKYKVTEPEYIKKQIRGMIQSERDKLLTMDFEDIWHQLWGSDTESSQRYANDRVTSKQKLAELRAGIEHPDGQRYTLADLLRQEPLVHNTPEWGFPKGRRDPYETDIQCAFRELQEETSISEDELWKATNVSPFIEQFYGSNNIHYRHSYYVAQYVGKRNITFNASNEEMAREVGNVSWKTLDEALLLLRPENVEKRGILIQLANLLRNFSSIFRDKIVGESLINRMNTPTENRGEEQQGQYVFISTTQGEGMGGRMERSRRFFGARQTHRRISDVRGPNTGTNSEGYRVATRSAGDRGFSVSKHRRPAISYEIIEET
jgi:8-oxo-dGTP pyrophosphatase MutT (NUDIX family)